MNTKTTNSDSDVSACNSWIVLCECDGSDKPDSEKCCDARLCTSEGFSDMVIVDNNELFENVATSKYSDNEDVTTAAPYTNNSNENFSDHEIIHDYEGKERSKPHKTHSKCKAKRKRRAKSKSTEVGTLFIIGTVLAITGASLLCLLTPKNVNLGTSNVNQLQSNCSKLGIIKDASLNQLPVKTTINRYGNKLNIQDKEGSLQTYLTNPNFTTSCLDIDKCYGPAPYQHFEKKIDAFNKQYGKLPSPPTRIELENKQIKKQIPTIAPISKDNIKITKLSEKISPESTKIPKHSTIPDRSTSKTETRKGNDMLWQCKLVCNVLQDLALLRLTQVVAKHLTDKAAKRKKKISMRADLRRKANAKRLEPLVKIRKPNNSGTELVLWEELPFNQDIPAKQSLNDIIKEESLRKVCSRASVTEIANTTPKSRLEKHRKRQMDYLDKLKQEHNNRMAYLRDIRERQQKSIQALIQERKQDFKKLNNYTEQQHHIMEGKRRLLEINDYYRKLKNSLSSKSASDFNHQVISDTCVKTQFCKKNNSLFNLSNSNVEKNFTSIPTISRKTNLSQEDNKNLLNINSNEYLNMRKKYFDQIAGYWSKREEYLNERISFMKEVSGSLKEVMCNFRKTNVEECNNSKCALANIISEASLVFPDNASLQKLKSEARMVDLNSLEDLNQTRSGLQLNRYCSLHSIDKNRYCPLSATKNNMIKDDTFYSELFGRKGSWIRKRDLAMWHYNKFPKATTKEMNQQEMRRKHFNKILKNELKVPVVNTV